MKSTAVGDVNSVLSEACLTSTKVPSPVKVYSDLSNINTIIKIEQENRKKSGVYGFINLKSKKLYIGSARDITKRFKEHHKGEKTNTHLHYSVQKNT
jgi:hypothetical protein